MLNIRDLERRWLRYKIKTFLPYAIITLSIAAIGVSLYLYTNTQNTQSPSVKPSKPADIAVTDIDKNATQPTKTTTEKKPDTKLTEKKEKVVTTPQQHIPAKPSPTTPVVQDTMPHTPPQQDTSSKVVLKPSMDFMKKMRTASSEYYISDAQIPQEVTLDTQQEFQQPKRTHTKKHKEKTKVVKAPVLAKKKIVIQRDTSLEDLKEVEKRFRKSNKPALSLFLAKQYYAIGNYKKAYNFALVTNQLDKENEASWLIFAKSLVKLGKKQLAIKTLKEYIRYSHSQNAQLLLNNIETGKFK